MARRYYSSVAARTTLSAGIDASQTTVGVVAVSGWPSSYPYTLIIDQDTVNEEIVEVTARSGTTLTVTRAVDGTTGKAHDAGAAVNHGVSARDFDEPNSFINGSGFIAPSIVTAKGDLLAATANGTVDNFPVGDNDYVLTADSSQTFGIKWSVAAAGAKGGGTNKVFWENDQTVTFDYTITNGANAGTFGPLTIGASVTVTVPSGATWTVV